MISGWNRGENSVPDRNIPARRYKVAYVLAPVTFGGLEKVSLTFLEQVDRRMFNLELILFLRPWETENVFEEELKRLGFAYTSIPVANNRFFDCLRVPRCMKRLQQAIAGNSYDLIHTHGYLADLLGYPVSQRAGIPIVSTCHGFIRGDLKLSLYNSLDLMVLRRFDRVIAVSDAIKDDLRSSKVKGANVTVIKNAAPMQKSDADPLASRNGIRGMLQVGPDELLLGYLGRLSEEKGIVHLLEAFRSLEERSLPVRLALIGDGPQRELLEKTAESLGIAGKTAFTGFQGNVGEWLAALDVFVIPSLSEGTPMALLEAMSMGLPCIASAVGGIPDVIDSGVDGILVAPGKPLEIRDAVLSLLGDEARRQDIGEKARETIRHRYDARSWAGRIENEYLRAIHHA